MENEVEEGQPNGLECGETTIHDFKGEYVIVNGWEEKAGNLGIGSE